MMNTRIFNRRRGIERIIAALAALAAGVALATAALAETPPAVDSLEKDFASPPAKWKSRFYKKICFPGYIFLFGKVLGCDLLISLDISFKFFAFIRFSN